MKTVLFASVVSTVGAGSLSLSFKDCGAKHAVTKDVQPTTLELGADTAITGTGSLDKDVSGGTYDMELKAGGGLIDSHFTGNNCEAKDFTLPLGLGTLSWDGIKCPLAASDSVSIGFHTKLAASLPAALATSDIHLAADDQDGESVLCVDLHLAKQKQIEAADFCSLYALDGDTCGQSDLDCDYVKYAKLAQKELKDGTCADQGYTVQTGTQTKSFPVIGDIVITTYSKGSLMEEPDVPDVAMGGQIFIEGFLEGFIGDATYIKACVGESVEVAQDLAHLVQHIKSRNLDKIISDLQALVNDGLADVKACKEIGKDLGPFMAAFKGVHSLGDLAKKLENNFLAHDKEILDLLEDMLDVCTFGAPDGHKCGVDAGKQVRKLVVGDTMVGSELEGGMMVFVGGFLEGFIGDAKHIKACIGESMEVAKDAMHLVADIKSRDLNKTISDVQALVTDGLDDVQACRDIGKDLGPFMAAFSNVHSLADLGNALKENFLAHDKEILDLLEDELQVCTFGAPDGHKCGVDAGKQVRKLVVGDTAVLV